MSTLVFDELITTLAQPITVKRRLNIASLFPTLYVHNAPVGTFYFKIKQGISTVFTFSFTSSDLKAKINTSENYLWGWFALLPNNGALLDVGEYEIELSSTGYTFNTSAFIGWVKMYDQYFGDISGPLPVDFTEFPFDYKLLERIPRELIK